MSPPKRRGVKARGCQVDGCSNGFPPGTHYYSRYRICPEHAATETMALNGTEVRFCQQCGRFQPLDEFDDSKRSCRRKLQMHRARRQRAKEAAKDACIASIKFDDDSLARSPRALKVDLHPSEISLPSCSTTSALSRSPEPSLLPIPLPAALPCGPVPVNAALQASEEDETVLCPSDVQSLPLAPHDSLEVGSRAVLPPAHPQGVSFAVSCRGIITVDMLNIWLSLPLFPLRIDGE